MTIPTLTAEELQAARAKATAARRRRAEVKAQVRAGALTLRQALDVAAEDDVVAHIKVYDLLRSLPRVGEKKATRIMERHDIAENRRLRGLGHHQVSGLLKEFGQE